MTRKEARWRRSTSVTGLGVAVAVATMSMTGPVIAAPAVGGTGSFDFDEAGAPVNIGAGITISGGGDYGGEYIEFAVDAAVATEILSLTTVGTPATGNGAVSVVGDEVFVGNGTSADVIGRIDPVLDGTGGSALRVHFAADFVNPSFETGDFTGWTTVNQQIDLGVTQLAGCTSADTLSYPGTTPNADNNVALEAGERTTAVLSTLSPTDGLWRGQLRVFGVTTTANYDAYHGPALVSSSFSAAAGDSVYFDWRTNTNGDQPHGGAFAVDASCNWTELLEFSVGAPLVWTPATGVLPIAGTYQLVFVAGTVDADGERVAGASLFVDNVRVHGAKATDSVVQDLARMLHYRNTSFSSPASRTVSVTAESGSTGIGGGSITVDITPAAEAPTATDQTLAGLSVGVAYADGVAATGWPVPTYSVTAGALPPGLALDSTTGAVTGTPTAGGAYGLTITASNIVGSAAMPFTLVVTAAPTGFVDATLGAPTVGATFIDGVLADGHPAPTYTVVAGSLPSGLALDTGTGVVTGVSTASGEAYSFTIRATNAHGSVDQAFAGTVSLAPAFDDEVLGTLVADVVLTDGVHAGGNPSPTYAVTDGALPVGLTIDATSGAITGTPTARGQAYRFTVTATNPAGAVARELTGIVHAAPLLDTAPLGTLRVGRSVDHPLGAHAVPAASFSIAAGALPAGLVIDPSTGAISGTPSNRGTYDVTVAAANLHGTETVHWSGVVEPAHRGYLGLTPARIFDSRLLAEKPAAGAVLEVDVLGRGGVPTDSTAVVLNLAITEPETDGFATVYPCGDSAPWAANVNFRRGDTVSNAVTTAPGANGRVCIFTMSRAHVVVDVNGAFSVTKGSGHLVPIEPARVVDTRDGGRRVAAGGVLEVIVAGRHSVPVDATAVILNVAVDRPATDGYATVHPCGEPVPFAANVNFAAGRTVSNAVVADVGANGAICVFTTAATDVVVDVDGAYSPAVGTGTLTAVTPERVFDSRSDRAPVLAGTVQEVAIGGRSSIPAGSVAVALNVAVTEPVAAGFVTVYPCGGATPWVANLTFAADQTVSNAVTVTLGAGGRVCFLASATTHLVVDINAVHVT